MHKKKLTICIPTYNRPKDIKVFLDTEMKFLDKYNVNVSIFDSSTDDRTKELVERINKENVSYLDYYRVDSSISANEKVFMIYQKMYVDYDYVWITHDHTIFNEESFAYIMDKLEEKADFYFIKTQCGNFGSFVTSDKCEFLYDSAWLLGKIGAAVIRSDSFLAGVDWDKLNKKYLTPQCLNFSHIGFYFERASEMPDFKAMTLEFPRDYFYDIRRFEKLSWDDEAIRICTQGWGKVIKSLPHMYTNKSKVYTTIDRYFLTKYKLIEYKKRKLFSIGTFLKYSFWIGRVFPELWWNAFIIAVLPYGICLRMMSKEIVKNIIEAKKQDRKICIYGAGKHAQECMEFCKLLEIDFDAVLVTNTLGNPDKICYADVYDAKSYLCKNRSFVVIAVAQEGQNEIVGYLQQIAKEGADLKYQRF